MEALPAKTKCDPSWPFIPVTEDELAKVGPVQLMSVGHLTFARTPSGLWVIVDTVRDDG